MSLINSAAFAVWHYIASVSQSTSLRWRYTWPEIVSVQPVQGSQQCCSTKYVIFGDKFTTGFDRFGMYRSRWKVKQVCESTTSLRNAGWLFFFFSAWSLKAQGVLCILTQKYLHLGAWASAEWEDETSLLKLYQFWSLGHLSSWDQTLHNQTLIVSYIYLASVKVDRQQHWRGIDKDGNSPRQQTKHRNKWNNQQTSFPHLLYLLSGLLHYFPDHFFLAILLSIRDIMKNETKWSRKMCIQTKGSLYKFHLISDVINQLLKHFLLVIFHTKIRLNLHQQGLLNVQYILPAFCEKKSF